MDSRIRSVYDDANMMAGSLRFLSETFKMLGSAQDLEIFIYASDILETLARGAEKIARDADEVLSG